MHACQARDCCCCMTASPPWHNGRNFLPQTPSHLTQWGRATEFQKDSDVVIPQVPSKLPVSHQRLSLPSMLRNASKGGGAGPPPLRPADVKIFIGIQVGGERGRRNRHSQSWWFVAVAAGRRAGRPVLRGRKSTARSCRTLCTRCCSMPKLSCHMQGAPYAAPGIIAATGVDGSPPLPTPPPPLANQAHATPLLHHQQQASCRCCHHPCML